jgi:prepilin peptidase CpaA
MGLFPILFLTALLVVAALSDLRSQRIPNWLTYPGIIIAIVYYSMTNGLDGFLFGLEGLGLGIGILLLPYVMGGMGAGDVKLLGAVGAMLGPRGVFVAFIFSALVGGIYALVVLMGRHGSLRTCLFGMASLSGRFAGAGRGFSFSETEGQGKPKLCYGVAIALGTWIFIGCELVGYRFLF